ncbi:DUF6461 domain-containing protein [Actinoplanes sichuanensis]|uniref:DUF6461 domain-containing protein n=1 Tax=Actinoplanes sichuanensis TaxID=512349 RepID=A0ABW4ATV5_9ACTN|nr:DUF6461 domain-containing protein [Actinoplanes sichuanensis]
MVDIDGLGMGFCLTFVRGRAPHEVISLLGGADPVSIVSSGAALEASVAVEDRVDDQGVRQPTRLDYVAVTRIDDWSMIIESNSVRCTDADVEQALSAAGETVSYYFTVNTNSWFSWHIDGREVVCFDPTYPEERYGTDPGRLDPVLTELGFDLEPEEREDDDDFDWGVQGRAVALMERITGVHWDAEILRQATFRCAGVGDRAPEQPWYSEVREQLADRAAVPRDWGDEIQRERWFKRGGPDRRVESLGHAGATLLKRDRDLTTAIACAPSELIERIITWARERPFRLAGVTVEPWFAPIRDLLRRGEQPTPADLRTAEERMDPFLRTALPIWVRDDENMRRMAVRTMLAPPEPGWPAADLCTTLSRAEGAGGGTLPDPLADLKRDFPELDDVVIPPAPAEHPGMRRRREARQREAAETRRRDLERRWGGRIPADERLLDPEVEMHTIHLVEFDRDLIDQIAAAPAEGQRTMAVWVARYCSTRSGMIAEDWIEAGVLALERGDPPPDWFADFGAAFAHWQGIPRESITYHGSVSMGGEEPVRIDPAVIAIHTILMARHDNPLIAAMDTVRNAIVLYGSETVITAFRAAFNLPAGTGQIR